MPRTSVDAVAGEDTLMDIIRAKWTMDGAETLSEAASKLRNFADSLVELEREGYRLDGPVADDYGFLVLPQPVGSA